MSKFFMRNRIRFVNEMEDNSILIMFAGEMPLKRGDEFYPFTPKRNFYYITGIDRPRIMLTIYKKNDSDYNATLYLERTDEIRAKWTGAVLNADKAQELSGIDNYKYIDEFNDSIANLIFNNDISNVYIDMENRYWKQSVIEDITFANELKIKYPAQNIINAYYIFSRLRMIKTEEEIENIKKAVQITREGIELMMKNIRPGMMEYEIEAYFDYALKSNGIKEKAFHTIAASGGNAAILHYSENNSQMLSGDLILFDLGAQFGYYSADISRTIPVNGKFTQRQKILYDIVLAGRQKVIDAVRPGIPFSDLNNIIINHYYEELKKLGLIETKEDIGEYYYHSIGHMLGLETHDTGRHREGNIEKGMVFTVEPGLYIAKEGIGIRIEDDIAVTDKGCEVLSKDIIKTIDEIEAFMRD